MTRLLIGNDFSEDARTDRGWTGWWVQRLVWYAEDGDILVLPVAPEDDFLRYVTGLTGTRSDRLNVVVPSGEGRNGMLTPDQLADPGFLARLREAIAGRELTEVLSLWPDVAIARLARVLGAESALPGYGFIDAAGGMLVNSKAMFRAIAAGAGVPLPPGTVCTSRNAAERAIAELLDEDFPVIVKHEFLSGGHGNEILSTTGGFRPVGARRVVKVSSRADVRSYLDDSWHWLSGGDRCRPVLEHYIRDSSAYFGEYRIAADGITLAGDGELLSAPYAIGQIMPSIGLEPHTFDTLIEAGRRLCEPLHAMGYRGMLAADAIVTPDRQVLFTEYNGRFTGSTHIYGTIGKQVVGPGYGKDRMILERVWPEGWTVPSFASALERLTTAGLAYDAATRAGVVLTNAFDNLNGVMYCIIAEDLGTAWARDRQLRPLFTTR
jgi:hypothetical protein